MATERKLGRTASQRKAMLRNLTTNLLWYGRIETTEARPRVRSIVDKMITLAIREYDHTVKWKRIHNDKKQIVKQTFSTTCFKLQASRLMLVYSMIFRKKKDDESRRTKGTTMTTSSRGGQAVANMAQVPRPQPEKICSVGYNPQLSAGFPDAATRPKWSLRIV
jgi:large subunit ribosomal protein L17